MSRGGARKRWLGPSPPAHLFCVGSCVFEGCSAVALVGFSNICPPPHRASATGNTVPSCPHHFPSRSHLPPPPPATSRVLALSASQLSLALFMPFPCLDTLPTSLQPPGPRLPRRSALSLWESRLAAVPSWQPSLCSDEKDCVCVPAAGWGWGVSEHTCAPLNSRACKAGAFYLVQQGRGCGTSCAAGFEFIFRAACHLCPQVGWPGFCLASRVVVRVGGHLGVPTQAPGVQEAPWKFPPPVG